MKKSVATSAAEIAVELEDAAYVRGYDAGYESGRGVPDGFGVIGVLMGCVAGAIAGCALTLLHLA